MGFGDVGSSSSGSGMYSFGSTFIGIGDTGRSPVTRNQNNKRNF